MALLAIGLGALALAWLGSQASPAWANRYFASLIGPALLLCGAGLAHAGRLGLVALAVVSLFWLDTRETQLKGKSNAHKVARTLQEARLVAPGDLVVSTHPEQTSVLRYYLGDGLRWATALGPTPDTRVFDWRDALERLEAARPKATAGPLIAGVAPGHRLVLIQPIVRTGQWKAPWTSLVKRRAAQWERLLDRDPRLLRVTALPRYRNRPLPRGVRAVVYTRLPDR